MEGEKTATVPAEQVAEAVLTAAVELETAHGLLERADALMTEMMAVDTDAGDAVVAGIRGDIAGAVNWCQEGSVREKMLRVLRKIPSHTIFRPTSIRNRTQSEKPPTATK